MARLGGGWCFLLNAASYVAVILGLLRISVAGKPSGERAQKHIGRELVEGLGYIWRTDVLRVTIAMVLAVGIFGLNYNVIVPVFADRVLHMDVQAYGNMLSAIGLGALMAAVAGAMTSRKVIAGRLIVMNGLAMGLIQMALSKATTFWLSAALLMAFGFSTVLFGNATTSTVQYNSDERIRGRVMSVYTLVDQGSMPVGNAFAGMVLDKMGANMGFPVCGGITLVALVGILAAQWATVRRTLFRPREGPSRI